MTETPRPYSQNRPHVVFVGFSDSRGGAARAMVRLYAAIADHESHRVKISVRVIERTINDDNIIGGRPKRSRLQRWRYFLITRFRKRFPRKELVSPNQTYRSQCLHPSGLGKELNRGPWDLAVLHWLGNRTLAIEEIGALKIPYMWHLHDMWLFSGADHTSIDRRYSYGYSRRSRPSDERGPDINRKVFFRKKRHWRSPRQLITPSGWLAEEAALSPITQTWPVTVIPNPIDTDYWKPIDSTKARQQFGVDPAATIFLFGAYAGANAFHKGPDLFFGALRILSLQHQDHPETGRTHILLFGKNGGVPDNLPFPATHLGPIDDSTLRLAYAASSAVVVPSRVESFGQIASEAHACGRPVVATRVGGLVDIVSDGQTGKLVDPESSEQLAEAMLWVVGSPERRDHLGKNARQKALDLWSPKQVAKQYVDTLLRQL